MERSPEHWFDRPEPKPYKLGQNPFTDMVIAFAAAALKEQAIIEQDI